MTAARGAVAGRASAEQIGTALPLERCVRVVPSLLGERTRSSALLELGVRGDGGAVHLAVALNWYRGELSAKIREDYPPQGVALDIHRRRQPDRTGFPVQHHDCSWLDGASCFHERLGHVLAEDLAQRLLTGGDELVWVELVRVYGERVG